MKLIQFHVRDYRCVSDSGLIQVDDAVTCLVGKNESGKTALLQALRRLNPPQGQSARFNQTEDYPRMRLRQYERALKTSKQDEAVVIEATFTLDSDDVDAIRQKFGYNLLAEPTLSLTLGYSNQVKAYLQVDEKGIVRQMTKDLQPDSAPTSAETLEQLEAILSDPSNEADGKTILPKVKSLRVKPLSDQIWESVLKARCPAFLYFDDYEIMKGKALLAELQNDEVAKSRPDLRTLVELLGLADMKAADLANNTNYEHHKASLEATANDISQEVFRYWRQNSELEVEFDVHRPGTQGQDQQATFYVRIKNQRHKVTVPFDERSRGFVWFFSFLVKHRTLADQGRPLIILLDEPGLNLHGKAQADLLRFIEERLAPTCQVIYTTHSPFMVDAHKLHRVRTVEDAAGTGTRVSADCLLSNSDTLFPLQAALGYDVAQSLFVGPNCLLVEGPSDLLYLQEMSRILADKGRTALDPRWVITPVGGADKLAAFVSLMGSSKLNLVVLMDVAKKDQQRIAGLVERRVLEQSRIIQIAEFTPQQDADIEDLFDPQMYFELARQALPGQLAAIEYAMLPQGPRIVKRIETRLGGRIDHYRVAAKTQGVLADRVDDATLERFSQLIEKVNGLAHQ